MNGTTNGNIGSTTNIGRIEDGLYYDPSEVANILGVTTSTLATWRCKKRGPSFAKLGRTIVYRGSDLRRFVERSRIDVEAA